jgi:hypothetical protein
MSALEKWQESGKPFYVSITGLQPKSIWKFVIFMRHAVPSRSQALKAPGNLFVGVKAINGVQHTLTIWESKETMKKYIYSGAHLLAIRAFRKIATGKTIGFESNTIPTWDEVHEIWKTKGISYD